MSLETPEKFVVPSPLRAGNPKISFDDVCPTDIHPSGPEQWFLYTLHRQTQNALSRRRRVDSPVPKMDDFDAGRPDGSDLPAESPALSEFTFLDLLRKIRDRMNRIASLIIGRDLV